MEAIAQRLKSFLQHKELTTSAFCRVLRYKSCEKIARLFRLEKAKPSVDILADIAFHFRELDMRWLITGQGEMLTPPTSLFELAEAAASKDEARLLVIHTANKDEYVIHQSYPSFILQSNGTDSVKVSRVTFSHSEREMERVSKPVLDTLLNFIENMWDEN